MALPNVKNIEKLLSKYNQEDVQIFCSYIQSIIDEKDKETGKMKNWHMAFRADQQIADFFMRVSREGMKFDGKHITLQSTWISYDYIAYKNKMLLVYPESFIDIGVVYEWDIFSFSKDSGKVTYSHVLSNPFVNDEKKIIWGYVVIKNKRWEFLTTLSKMEIEKHKASAKSQTFWAKWFVEMVRKTLIKKACKQHFEDIFTAIEEDDNEQYDPTITTPEERSYVDEINAIDNLNDLVAYFKANEGKWKEFVSHLTKRKEELIAEKKAQEEEEKKDEEPPKAKTLEEQKAEFEKENEGIELPPA